MALRIPSRLVNRQYMRDSRGKRAVLKVEPYPIPGSFSKLKYLKTELNADNGTYAIVKLTSHSYRIMIHLSIICYFELMWYPLPTYLAVFRFLAKCQDSPFPWKPNSTIWSFMSLVRCKVLPKPGICTMSMWKTFLNVPICLKITKSTWFTLLMPIFRSCHTTRYLWHDLAPRGGLYLPYSITMASKTVSFFTFNQKMFRRNLHGRIMGLPR